VICTDKTGTLTQNRMMVERVWTPVGEHVVSGRGYAPDGEVDASTAEAAALTRVGRVAAACNDASLHAPTSPGGEWTITGDPTEGALLAFAAKVGVERGDLDAERPRRAEIGFDASRRRMTTAHHLDGGCWVATKGALGALRPLLHADEHDRADDAARAADRFAADGYRVLALAERTACALPDPLDALEHDLHLVGIVAITDPPRPEARDAIATCRAAGITPVMITGDHPSTARAIARRVGLIDDDEAVLVTGDELDALDDAALAARVADVRVFARTDPAQKLRIVDAWKARGATVAMTGDGVNDAPALRRADIGVAMGITGTEVSREAADMVLADDDFATIVGAVEEGRRIGDNIRRFVRYMLATNSGEVFVMFLAPLVGLPVPLTPAQILWINLVTDGPPAVALGLEPVEPDAMVRPPRPPDEPVLTRDLWQRALGVGLLMAAVAIGVQAVSRAAGWPARTMVFTTLALLQLGNALAVRSDRTRHGNPWLARAVVLGVAAQLAAVYVPGLRELFDATPLTGLQLLVAVAASTTVYVVVRSGAILRRMRPSGAGG
jgi:Ca2+-transporting ATPase